MSDRILTEEEKAAAARRGPAGARQGGPPHMALGAPGEKPKSFLASAKRLLGLLRPERALVILYVSSRGAGLPKDRNAGCRTVPQIEGSTRLDSGTVRAS